MQELTIITNESIYSDNDNFYCDNLDIKTLSEGLSNEFKVHLIGRLSQEKRFHKINIKNISIFKSLFGYLNEVNKSSTSDKSNLVVSITPFTFCAVLISFFKKKPKVYLRSDGHKEYKAVLGPVGKFIFHVMFLIVSKFSNFIACSKEVLHGKKGSMVFPSQLDDSWFEGIKKPSIKEANLIYVGRIKKEKGIFSFLSLIKKIQGNYNFTIVGATKDFKKTGDFERTIIHEIVTDKKKLIDLYDNHNIFVLPSFTEGHPMVLLESLARKRPVIIFDDIKHVVQDKKGIFICKRNKDSLYEKINYILGNYESIYEELKNNRLPTYKDFISDISKEIKN
tara:strand:- start:2032 stop:3042 length:1011 start_codon:yes stop_codon:yes gene_type:complete